MKNKKYVTIYIFLLSIYLTTLAIGNRKYQFGDDLLLFKCDRCFWLRYFTSIIHSLYDSPGNDVPFHPGSGYANARLYFVNQLDKLTNVEFDRLNPTGSTCDFYDTILLFIRFLFIKKIVRNNQYKITNSCI